MNAAGNELSPAEVAPAASARLDLSLALTAAGRHNEAAGTTLEAISSGRLVPLTYWRAREVIQAVAERGVPQAAEAYREACSERPVLLAALLPGSWSSMPGTSSTCPISPLKCQPGEPRALAALGCGSGG